jgi:hypothetical protein
MICAGVVERGGPRRACDPDPRPPDLQLQPVDFVRSHVRPLLLLRTFRAYLCTLRPQPRALGVKPSHVQPQLRILPHQPRGLRWTFCCLVANSLPRPGSASRNLTRIFSPVVEQTWKSQFAAWVLTPMMRCWAPLRTCLCIEKGPSPTPQKVSASPKVLCHR